MGIRESVLEALNRFRSIGVDPVVGGSFASSAWGQPRQTNDIDLMARLGPQHEELILSTFRDKYAIGPQELNWAVNSNEPGRSFSLTGMEDGFKIDVFVSDNTPHERSEFERARRIQLFEGVEALVSSPEDTVLQKLRWYELGHRVSDRQWNDIVQVIEVQGPDFDRDYFCKWAEELGISELAGEALIEARDIG